MPDSLLVTKLITPRPVGPHLERAHVTSILREGLQRRLTTLIAGAGYGKSATLAHFLAGSGLPFLWFQLDSQDSDLATFCQYLGHGVHQCLQGGSLTVSRLRSAATAVSPGGMLPALIQDLSDCPPGAIALDDFHLIAADSPVMELLPGLLLHLPPQIHLYITSRTPLPFPVARWKVRQEAAEVSGDDLRFSAAEVAGFFRSALQVEFDPAAQDQIVHLTEGWPAALVLLSAAVRRRGSAQFLAANQLPEDVFDYLAEEVLSGLTPGVRGFLEEASVLDVCQVDACCAILGRDDAQQILSSLAGSNLLIARLGHDLFRQHHLLQRFLHERLVLRDGGKSARDLHRRAAEWFASQHMHEQAVRHFLQANQGGRAAGLVEFLAPGLLHRNQLDRLRALLALLPSETRGEYPWITYCDARQHFAQGNLDIALGLAHLAIRTFAGQGDRRGLVQGHVLTGVIMGARQRYDEVAAELDKAELHLQPGFVAEEATILRQRALLSISTQGANPAAESHLRRALALFIEASDAAGEAGTAEILGLVRAHLGDHASAVSLLERSAAILQSMGEPACEVGVNLGWVYLQVGRFQDALAIFSPILSASTRKVRRAHAALYLMETHTRLGEFERAHSLAHAAHGLIEELGNQEARLSLLCAMAALQRLSGKAEAASTYLKEALQLAEGTQYRPGQLRAIAEAALLHVGHTGNNRAVQKLVARALARMSGDQERLLRTLLLACDAVATSRQARNEWRSEAVRLLQACLADCRRFGYEFLALQEWPLMLSVALVGLAYNTEADVCLGLIRRMHGELPERIRDNGILLAEAEGRLLPAAWQALPDEESRRQLMGLLTPADRRRLMGLAAGPAPMQVRCLGTLAVQIGNSAIDHKALKRRKAGPLLALLLGHEAAVAREDVLESLWPDLDPDAADTSLRVTIHYVRRMLEPHLGGRGKSRYIQAEGGLVWFSRQSEVEIDIDRFRRFASLGAQASAEGNLAGAVQHYEQALAHYGGPLAAGDQSAQLEHLRAAETSRCLTLLGWLGNYYITEAPDLIRAATYYQRALALDPPNEVFHQALIRILLELGQVAEARRQLEQCRTAVRQWVDAELSAATVSLERVIASMETEPGNDAVQRPGRSPGTRQLPDRRRRAR